MFADLTSSLIGLVIILAVCIGVFLALREVTLWYFRINQIADDLAVIAAHYRSLRPPRPIPPGYVEVTPPPPAPKFHPQTGQPLP